MAHELKGLPGLYKKARQQKAVAAAPDGVEASSKEINKLKEWVAKLEKKILGD